MSRKKHTIVDLTKRYESEELDENIIKKTLIKKAKGFVLEEISEEYAKEEGKALTLLKRKVITKEVAPDINAIKVLIELNEFDKSAYKTMTDEELTQEKNRLLKLLEEVGDYD